MIEEQLTPLELCTCDALCACVDEKDAFGYLKSVMNLTKLFYANSKNLTYPGLECYAAGGPSQLDVRIVESSDLQSKLQKPDNYPAIIVDFSSVVFTKLVLGDNAGVDSTKSREALSYSAKMPIVVRHVIKNPADLLALARQTYDLILALGAPMLYSSGVKRLVMGSIKKTNAKIPIPDEYFGVDLDFEIEYIASVVRVNQAHRIAGIFQNTSTQQ